MYKNSEELFNHLLNVIEDEAKYDQNLVVDIATYGMYVGISKGKDLADKYPSEVRTFLDAALKLADVRLVIGLTYFLPCTEGCTHCLEKYNEGIDRLIDTKEMLGIENVRINPSSHFKYYRIGDRVWTGGINLTGSDWVDISMEVTDYESAEELMSMFKELWEDSETDIEEAYKE